jgi:Coenzyme PQQ synthesis protein D (PqqD)
MNIEPGTIPQREPRRAMIVSPDIRWNLTDEGGLLLDIKTSKYYSLNSIGAVIWDGLVAGSTIDELAGRVRERFHASRDQVQSDVTAFVQSLEQKGVISYASPACN